MFRIQKTTIRIAFWILPLGLCVMMPAPIRAEFPEKPIKIIVYMAPGGLIDTTTRKFIEIAKMHTDATFVVENKPGSGGIIAIEHVLQQANDGYTLLACTKSNISKLVASAKQDYVPSLDWVAMLMRDPECVITLKESEISSWQELIQDAKDQDGNQIWLGPDRGGLDHVMALKTWERAQIRAKWIPFTSGGAAKGALLGKQGVAYVGNPRDIAGNDSLHLTAISAPKRLPQFPDTPTFEELGIQDLDNEFMWRGFALKRGVRREVLEWYQKLFRQVTDDPAWRSIWEKDGIEVTYLPDDEFAKVVKQDLKDFEQYLSQLNIINKVPSGWLSSLTTSNGQVVLLALLSFTAILGAFWLSGWRRNQVPRFVIPLLLAVLSCFLIVQSTAFPEGDGVGPGFLPIILAALSAMVAIYICVREKAASDQVPTNTAADQRQAVWFLMLASTLYCIVVVWVGYLMATAFFLPITIAFLGFRDLKTIAMTTCIWLAVSYLVFIKILFVQLPTGRVWDMLL